MELTFAQHPTRNIYMLSHLETSVGLKGTWYTDNELDIEFIQLLCNACLWFIQEKKVRARGVLTIMLKNVFVVVISYGQL